MDNKVWMFVAIGIAVVVGIIGIVSVVSLNNAKDEVESTLATTQQQLSEVKDDLATSQEELTSVYARVDSLQTCVNAFGDIMYREFGKFILIEKQEMSKIDVCFDLMEDSSVTDGTTQL